MTAKYMLIMLGAVLGPGHADTELLHTLADTLAKLGYFALGVGYGYAIHKLAEKLLARLKRR